MKRKFELPSAITIKIDRLLKIWQAGQHQQPNIKAKVSTPETFADQ